jgi:hypothetical protein
MPAAIDITGQRFGRLVVLALHSRGKGHVPDRFWACVCDCGKRAIVAGYNLRCGKTKSCGCLKLGNLNQLTHGQRSNPAYNSWSNMLQRCLNSNDPAFVDYGGRGITVCERWRSFASFFEDMGPRQLNYSIERIDVNGNYEPANCKWIPLSEQPKNTRRVQKSRAIQPGKSRRRSTPQEPQAGTDLVAEAPDT